MYRPKTKESPEAFFILKGKLRKGMNTIIRISIAMGFLLFMAIYGAGAQAPAALGDTIKVESDKSGKPEDTPVQGKGTQARYGQQGQGQGQGIEAARGNQNKPGVKPVQNARPNMGKSRGARPPVIVRPAGAGIPKGAGKPGGAGGSGRGRG